MLLRDNLYGERIFEISSVVFESTRYKHTKIQIFFIV